MRIPQSSIEEGVTRRIWHKVTFRLVGDRESMVRAFYVKSSPASAALQASQNRFQNSCQKWRSMAAKSATSNTGGSTSAWKRLRTTSLAYRAVKASMRSTLWLSARMAVASPTASASPYRTQFTGQRHVPKLPGSHATAQLPPTHREEPLLTHSGIADGVSVLN